MRHNEYNYLMSDTQNSAQESSPTYNGCCKWFNSRRGFGFITLDNTTRGDNADIPEDIFVHQSNICPTTSTYRTLSQGEYVSFALRQDGEKYHAVNVTGLNGGPLMCDSNNNNNRRNPRRRRIYGNQDERPEGEWVWRPYRRPANDDGSESS